MNSVKEEDDDINFMVDSKEAVIKFHQQKSPDWSILLDYSYDIMHLKRGEEVSLTIYL